MLYRVEADMQRGKGNLRVMSLEVRAPGLEYGILGKIESASLAATLDQNPHGCRPRHLSACLKTT